MLVSFAIDQKETIFFKSIGTSFIKKAFLAHYG